ncbi:hypothetical protein, partial [Anaerovibrio sp.]|uniref:hypothetical protein n=1 Tax=Anaerovibrio sp. TaxID=1872532 RepID=UPI0025BCE719
VANDGNGRIQNFKKIIKKHGVSFWGFEIGGSQKANVIPRLMYKDGKYYRFAAGFGMVGKDSKNDQAIMLPEEDLKSPELNPLEGWAYIRTELALPLEFSVFNYRDSFLDSVSMVEMPVYQESTERNIGKKTYNCDKYIAKEKFGESDKVNEFIYYALYKEGKLALIQKYRVPKVGEEEIVEEIFVRDISAQLPENSFEFSNEIPVFAAGMGDVNDFLGIPVQVGVLGGNVNAK